MRTDIQIPASPPAPPRRRPLVRALIVLLVLGLVAVVTLAGIVAMVWFRADVSNVGRLDFANRLQIPPLQEPRTDAGGTKVLALRLQAGTSHFLPGRTTPTWGANGAYLGPTLHASRGDKVRIDVTNDLPEATTIHWHGMHLPARADGGPHQMIQPEATWSPTWTIDQPAATLWYHPHPHRKTEDHVSRGLSGLFLLDDPQARTLPLPKRYGVDDVPVIIQDKRFRGDGRFAGGDLGSDILVNGTYNPHLPVVSRLVRFRLLNASTARSYNIGFADNRPFDQIASDGGLLQAPYRTTRVQLSPGERAEIVAAFQPGERVVLRSFQPDLGENFLAGRFNGASDTFDLLQVRAASNLRAAPAVPARLANNQRDRLDPASATRTRRIAITSSDSIDGKSMDMDRIDQVVTLGTTEIWEVRNQSGSFHNFHVHDVQFKVLQYNGAAPPPNRAGWKDTVPLPPDQSVRFVTRFTDYADPSSPYMFHCHLLRHEDNGLMGQFVVVQPGHAAAPSPAHRHHG
ncbi:MAG TPA: multicopper oxidase domain-containing protein [Actinomycetes bacterium]|jgi:FtsP/CotA-like multicopper oxidase with cupredoxin domain|nr:multicopper oxidase domain-containing protein [Actinomycetes bacterium]